MATTADRTEALAKAQRLRKGFDLTTRPGAQIDRRTCHRTRPMEVLCFGLSRTGTAALRCALLELGYFDVYHMVALMLESPRDSEMWCEALDAKFYGKGKLYGKEEWDQLLGHCMAVTDDPCTLFASDLVAAYPDAKIILTVRDTPEVWCKSVSETFLRHVRFILQPTRNPFLYMFRILQSGQPFDGVYARMFPTQSFNPLNSADTPEGPKRYLEHNDMVRKLAGVPQGGKTKRTDRFLEFNVKEGWGPLCEFLGKEVPTTSFPRVNDRAHLRGQLRILWALMAVGAFGNALKYLSPFVAIAAGWWWLKLRA